MQYITDQVEVQFEPSNWQNVNIEEGLKKQMNSYMLGSTFVPTLRREG